MLFTGEVEHTSDKKQQHPNHLPGKQAPLRQRVPEQIEAILLIAREEILHDVVLERLRDGRVK